MKKKWQTITLKRLVSKIKTRREILSKREAGNIRQKQEVSGRNRRVGISAVAAGPRAVPRDSFAIQTDPKPIDNSIFFFSLKSLLLSQLNTMFSGECTTGMVWGLTALKHYGTMALWHYGTMAQRH